MINISDFDKLIKIIKKYLPIIISVCIIVVPTVWLIMEKIIFPNRLAELQAKIYHLQCELEIKEVAIVNYNEEITSLKSELDSCYTYGESVKIELSIEQPEIIIFKDYQFNINLKQTSTTEKTALISIDNNDPFKLLIAEPSYYYIDKTEFKITLQKLYINSAIIYINIKDM